MASLELQNQQSPCKAHLLCMLRAVVQQWWDELLLLLVLLLLEGRLHRLLVLLNGLSRS
jgi:hypothetical protein